LLNWIKEDRENRDMFLIDLLRNIRLPLCSLQNLARLRTKEPLIIENKSACQFLNEPILYHLLPNKRIEYKRCSRKLRSCFHEKNGLIYVVGDRQVDES
jgi:hypothetical protein